MARTIREQLIKQLANGEFVSGQLLGEQAGISRAAVSKHINAISEMGLDVFRVSGKGYQLAQPIELLDQTLIAAQLKQLGHEICVEVHSIIDSTNSYLLRKVPNQIQHQQACIAEYQTAGRGRRGRQWISPFGSHIYFSLYWQLDHGMSQAMGLSLVVALALSDAIKAVCQLEVQLKWPNDLYLAGKKVAGILIELEGQADGPSHCVIGVGLNLRMPLNCVEKISQPWADLYSHCETMPDRNEFAAVIIHCLIKRMYFHQTSGFKAMMTEWHDKDLYLNKPVRLMTGNNETQGIYRGVNEQGAMLLEIGGQLSPIWAGEVSLREAR